ncbi:MAG TPA: nickel pincer cofactor biosynthesis protein LarC [Abditibacteriaceae bacterium]|jgi:hypothetical protein
MKIAYFDCFSGIAGDMLLGAFLDCGVPLDALKKGLASLPVSGWDIEATPVLQSGIHGIKVRVTLDGKDDSEHSHADYHHDHNHSHHDHTHDGHDHSHDAHAHSHGDHSHHHEPAHEHSHAHEHGRSMAEIRAVIEASELSPRVKATALDIFGRIAVVEAEMHHSTPEEIHFHEIGGVDSLIDICGAAWCLEYLGVDAVHCSALPYSTGFVNCAHGRMPVPAPATMKLLRGAPMFPTGLTGEMITPTGAGIIASLAKTFGDPPAFIPREVGFGAGTKTWPDRPNLLRVSIGEATGPVEIDRTLKQETLVLLETNVDDMNPELWDFVIERVFAAGALDAWLTPIQMKKNRAAHTFSALCEENTRAAVLESILRETTTLGVRESRVTRRSLPRTVETAETPWGEVRIKVARWPEGNIERGAPEYDDVARVARAHSVAASEVYNAARHAWHSQKSTETKLVEPPSNAPVDAHSHGEHSHWHSHSHHTHSHGHSEHQHAAQQAQQ